MREHAHTDLDRIFVRQSAIAEMARYGAQSRDTNGPGPKNSVGDPTGEAAVRGGKYRVWLDRKRAVLIELMVLANQAEELVPQAPLPVCSLCRQLIEPQQSHQRPTSP